MEVLNALTDEADRRLVLSPLPGDAIKYRASVYADDLVIFLAPTANDFTCIRNILELFAGARFGPDVFRCRVQDFPTRYLGTPLSISRLSRADELVLVDAVAVRIPTWKAGSESVAGGRCKVAWPVVCSPREHGGLGLPDHSVLGFALRLRWEWIRRTQPDTVWEHLPSRPERAIDQMFRASVTVQVGDGAAARFWMDSWLPAGAI
ncbi:uncharacterized protein [Miscanthus floridulus]|uniref:uncharacterized protein n=1 Tax=Miscanthus floridulus TaxID=154761 RepID=UPI00345813F7